jgi:YqzE-like protein
MKLKAGVSMKTNDYVKYMTQTIVKYADQPRDERRRLRTERKETKASFWYRWFGILPYVLYFEVKKRRRR